MNDIIWKNNRISRFVLGTAQLGADYGISNVQGQPSEKQACEIVNTAWEFGVNCFDTAQIYNSEAILGEALKQVISDTKIVTKLSPYLKPSDSNSIMQSIEKSRQELGVDQLWCLMLHKADWLNVLDEGLGQTLADVKKRGLVKYLGISVYSPDDAHRALKHPDIQVIQVPCNAWDQRMLEEGIFALAKKMDKLCLVRSVYLQGLLVLSPTKVAEKLPQAQEAAQKWFALATKFDMEPQQLAIRFGLSLNTPLVIGMENIQQVEENIRLCKQMPLAPSMIEEIRNEMSPLLNENIVNPALWKQ